MPEIGDAWIVLIGTLFGGAGLKLIESLLGKKKARDDQSAQMREELRQQIIGLREELYQARQEEQRLEQEIEKWRGMYYDLRDVYSKIQTELMLALAKLKVERESGIDEEK